MGRDLFEETIIATDKGEINEAGDNTMGAFPPSYSAGSCPEKAGDITINQTIINVADGEGTLKVDKLEFADFDAPTNKIAALSFEPIAAYPVEVEINGVGQVDAVDYTIVGTVFTLTEALPDGDVVIVRYAYEAI
jgi:hypothetical protein